MGTVKNVLKRKQKVLIYLVPAGESIELTADEMKHPKVKHGIDTGVLEEAKRPYKTKD